MNSITKRTTITKVTCARKVRANTLLRASARALTLLLLLGGLPAISANKATDVKASKPAASKPAASKPAATKQASDSKTGAGSAGGEGWAQDKNKAEALLHIADASNSVYLAAKLTTPADIQAARQLLRKSAQELANSPTHPKQVIGEPLGKLISDFAFLQSVASQPTIQSPNSPPMQNLKDVCTDYDFLIPAAEKQLGPNDFQVKGLKTLRTTMNQSLNPQKRQK